MSIADFMGGGAKVPTTDEMDKTTPEERYALVAMCTNGHWHHFTGSRERFSQTEGEKCGECGIGSFHGGSLISERTWKPEWKPSAKKRR